MSIPEFFIRRPVMTTLVTAGITIFGTIQLLVIGVFGEYLGRIYEQVKQRPLYIVQDIAGGDGQHARLGYLAEATANSERP